MYLSGSFGLAFTNMYFFFAALRIIYNFAIQRIACRRNHIGYVCSHPHRCSPPSEMHWTVAKKKAYIWVQKYKQKWNKMADIYRNLTGSWENLTFYDTTSALSCFIHWFFFLLRIAPFTRFKVLAHGGCDRSTVDAYSSLALDPTSEIFAMHSILYCWDKSAKLPIYKKYM